MTMNGRIVTAGVFVNCGGMFPLKVGPAKSGATLGVVRIGGHREDGETGWQCASREAFEEASVRVFPIRPPATYWYEAADESELTTGGWQADDVVPILVGQRQESNRITPMYLAYSADSPVPAAEAKGLLLLAPSDIALLATRRITL